MTGTGASRSRAADGVEVGAVTPWLLGFGWMTLVGGTGQKPWRFVDVARPIHDDQLLACSGLWCTVACRRECDVVTEHQDVDKQDGILGPAVSMVGLVVLYIVAIGVTVVCCCGGPVLLLIAPEQVAALSPFNW
jgi:hypothetical protein